MTWAPDMATSRGTGDGAFMPVDLESLPVDPPAGCRHPLLWRVARALWEAHQPDTHGWCEVSACRRRNERHPCPHSAMALEALHAASVTPTARPWIAEVRQRVEAGELDPIDAVAEALWRHRQHREERGR